MRRALLFMAALAACDDESLPAKVANAQLHGVTAARIECLCQFDLVAGGSGSTHDFMASKLQDGSCLTQSSGSGTFLWPRSDARAEGCDSHRELTAGLMRAVDGELRYVGDNSLLVTEIADIETCCTGFNLEAFGVEP